MEEKGKGISFVRRAAGSGGGVSAVGARAGPHGTSFVSSGLADLDEILGGGIPVGGIMMVMEDLDAPHHMLLLRFFMAQGLAHGQPLLFASPLPSPKSFLGTLPGLSSEVDHGNSFSRHDKHAQGDDLRIAWQYRRYLNEQQELEERRLRQQELTQSRARSSSRTLDRQRPTADFRAKFDLRKVMQRTLLSAGNIECMSLKNVNLSLLEEKCATFFGGLTRDASSGHQVGRIALQSLCAPQCMLSISDWEMLAFLHGLKIRLREARAVAFITFPSTLLKASVCARWQHLSDILLSVEAIHDEGKDMKSPYVGYRDMVGFLMVHKRASINSQVPAIVDVGSFAIKVLPKKNVVLERLHLAPIDASAGKSSGAIGLPSAKLANVPSSLDF